MPRLHPMQNYPLLSHTAKRSQMQSAGCVMKTMMKNWCLSHHLAFQRMLWVAESIWSIVVLHPELRSESGSRLSCCAQNTRSSMCATDNVGSAVSCAQPDKVSSCCPVKDITVLVLCRWGPAGTAGGIPTGLTLATGRPVDPGWSGVMPSRSKQILP